MADTIEWRCACGEMRARVELGEGTHLVCYCDDCQAFARATGRPDWLDDAGGSDLYQTVPDRVEVIQGAERLACLRLTDKGPYRWYARCCGAPFANTLTTRQVPFASIAVHGLDRPDALGPIMLRANRKFASKRVDAKGSLAAAGVQILRRAAVARLAGRHRRTPFFDHNGAPVAEPRRLSPDERRAAYTRPATH